jgi:hypothetical protein
MRPTCRITILALASSVAPATACGGDDGSPIDAAATFDSPQVDASGSGPYALAWAGTGYAAGHNGQTLHFALWDDADAVTAVVADTTVVAGSTTEADFPGALVAGHSYHLYWYADVDASSGCNVGDHNWSLTVLSVTGPVNVTHPHSVSFNGDCSKHPAP